MDVERRVDHPIASFSSYRLILVQHGKIVKTTHEAPNQDPNISRPNVNPRQPRDSFPLDRRVSLICVHERRNIPRIEQKEMAFVFAGNLYIGVGNRRFVRCRG